MFFSIFWSSLKFKLSSVSFSFTLQVHRDSYGFGVVLWWKERKQKLSLVNVRQITKFRESFCSTKYFKWIIYIPIKVKMGWKDLHCGFLWNFFLLSGAISVIVYYRINLNILDDFLNDPLFMREPFYSIYRLMGYFFY